MTREEYNWFYLYYIITGSVDPYLRHQLNLAPKIFEREKTELVKLPNHKIGINLLILISIIESNFLNKNGLVKKLENLKQKIFKLEILIWKNLVAYFT